MEPSVVQSKIKAAFHKQVQKDKKIKSAFLLVHSDKLNISLNISGGEAEGPGQLNHMASVGKLFTATLISILYEKDKLSFNDPINKFLDTELMNGLLVLKGKDYSDKITVRHLLMQTSGLNDVFYHLWKKLIKNPDFNITAREAVLWGKKNLKPVAIPGKKFFYTDTNYYLLGMIIENITGKKFHEVMHQYVFNPLGMKHAYMYGFSTPQIKSVSPVAGLFMKGTNFLSVEGVHHIDYSGGSVVAPLEEFLLFMKALLNQKIIKKETLDIMLNDDVYMGFPTLGFNYGYAIWKLKTIPLIMPSKYFCWGGVGVTGAFMFFHPRTETFLIGTFNDYAYRGKALEFMVKKVIKELLKLE